MFASMDSGVCLRKHFCPAFSKRTEVAQMLKTLELAKLEEVTGGGGRRRLLQGELVACLGVRPSAVAAVIADLLVDRVVWTKEGGDAGHAVLLVQVHVDCLQLRIQDVIRCCL